MARGTVISLSVALGVIFIAVMTITLGSSKAATYLLDHHELSLFRRIYPLTIQNVMHLIFFGAMGDLTFQWQRVRGEHRLLNRQLLPERDEVVLQAADLAPLRRTIHGLFDEQHGVVPALIDLCILRFQASGSVSQTATVLSSALSLFEQQVELRYTLSRYVSWLLPTIGFIGTVIGIGETLSAMDPEQPDLAVLTGTLGVAFSTTLIALLLSVLLVLMQSWVQGQDELAVNRAGSYTLRNLVNRLYAPQAS